MMQPQAMNKSAASILNEHDTMSGGVFSNPYGNRQSQQFRTDSYLQQSSQPFIAQQFIPKQTNTFKPGSQNSPMMNYGSSDMLKSMKPMQNTNYTMDYKTPTMPNMQGFQADKIQNTGAGLLPNPTALKYPPYSAANSRVNTANKVYPSMPMTLMADPNKNNNMISMVQQNPVQGLLSRPYSRGKLKFNNLNTLRSMKQNLG